MVVTRLDSRRSVLHRLDNIDGLVAIVFWPGVDDDAAHHHQHSQGDIKRCADDNTILLFTLYVFFAFYRNVQLTE